MQPQKLMALVSAPSKPVHSSCRAAAEALQLRPAHKDVCKEPLRRLESNAKQLVEDEPESYKALVARQEANLPKIKAELDEHGRKRGCWAWWVFPTDKAGKCDPAETRVNVSNASKLCNNPSTARLWQDILETICDLVDQKGMGVLPSRDHGRVYWFVKFWLSLEDSPRWMHAVCHRLDRHEWQPC